MIDANADMLAAYEAREAREEFVCRECGNPYDEEGFTFLTYRQTRTAENTICLDCQNDMDAE